MQAQRAGIVLREGDFGLVLTSPMHRARQTAELAGFPDAVVEPDATEWAYGEYEGLTTDQIRERDPGWTIWRGVTPGGETAAEVAARADRVVAHVRGTGVARVLLFSHGHFLRVVAARWLGLPAEWGERLKLGTAALCELGWEREAPAVVQWNLRPRCDRPDALTRAARAGEGRPGRRGPGNRVGPPEGGALGSSGASHRRARLRHRQPPLGAEGAAGGRGRRPPDRRPRR